MNVALSWLKAGPEFGAPVRVSCAVGRGLHLELDSQAWGQIHLLSFCCGGYTVTRLSPVQGLICAICGGVEELPQHLRVEGAKELAACYEFENLEMWLNLAGLEPLDAALLAFDLESVFRPTLQSMAFALEPGLDGTTDYDKWIAVLLSRCPVEIAR